MFFILSASLRSHLGSLAFLLQNGFYISGPILKVKVAQSCLTLCDSMDYTVHGILQARILEWVAFPFSRGSLQLRSPTLQADSLPPEPQGKPCNIALVSASLLVTNPLCCLLFWKPLLSSFLKNYFLSSVEF